MGESENKEKIIQELFGLGNFGLCRAHAVNLGRLIWALAYQKAHNPKQFWKAALKHCQGSYRRWVHKTEAKNVGWDLRELGYPNGITGPKMMEDFQKQAERFGTQVIFGTVTKVELTQKKGGVHKLIVDNKEEILAKTNAKNLTGRIFSKILYKINFSNKKSNKIYFI